MNTHPVCPCLALAHCLQVRSHDGRGDWAVLSDHELDLRSLHRLRGVPQSACMLHGSCAILHYVPSSLHAQIAAIRTHRRCMMCRAYALGRCTPRRSPAARKFAASTVHDFCKHTCTSVHLQSMGSRRTSSVPGSSCKNFAIWLSRN